MDAILSSLSMRDIGYHFSDKDPQYKDADSMKLLSKVLKMIDEKGYAVKSVSATIMAEKPKLLNHIPTITENLAKALSLPLDKVGIGATTLEGLGFVGREEAISVHATVTVTKI
jgi:2-C-methyl-D-erythritol 2,4-cyclodiphosphate synthase